MAIPFSTTCKQVMPQPDWPFRVSPASCPEGQEWDDLNGDDSAEACFRGTSGSYPRMRCYRAKAGQSQLSVACEGATLTDTVLSETAD